MKKERRPLVILITGASSGLGNECANLLSTFGHIVYGSSRNKYSHANNNISMLEIDVTNTESIALAVSRIINEQGRIDVLINNAGVGTSGALELSTQEEYELTFNTNVLGTINMCQQVVPHMRKQRSGRIINISSIAGIIGIPFQGLYSASKFAIEGLSETYALELKPFGIDVCLVEPGDFNTNFTKNRLSSLSTTNNNDYSLMFYECMKIIIHSEENGEDPQFFAKKILKLVNSKHPKFRTIIGPFSQVFPIKLLKFIPQKFAQKTLSNMYALKTK